MGKNCVAPSHTSSCYVRYVSNVLIARSHSPVQQMRVIRTAAPWNSIRLATLCPFQSHPHHFLGQQRRVSQCAGSGEKSASPSAAPHPDEHSRPQFLGKQFGILPLTKPQRTQVHTAWDCPCGFHNYRGPWCYSCGGPSTEGEAVAESANASLPPATDSSSTSVRGPLAERETLLRVMPSSESKKFDRKTSYRAAYPPREPLPSTSGARAHPAPGATAIQPKVTPQSVVAQCGAPNAGIATGSPVRPVAASAGAATKPVLSSVAPVSTPSAAGAAAAAPAATPQPSRATFKVVKLTVHKK